MSIDRSITTWRKSGSWPISAEVNAILSQYLFFGYCRTSAFIIILSCHVMSAHPSAGREDERPLSLRLRVVCDAGREGHTHSFRIANNTRAGADKMIAREYDIVCTSWL